MAIAAFAFGHARARICAAARRQGQKEESSPAATQEIRIGSAAEAGAARRTRRLRNIILHRHNNTILRRRSVAIRRIELHLRADNHQNRRHRHRPRHLDNTILGLRADTRWTAGGQPTGRPTGHQGNRSRRPARQPTANRLANQPVNPAKVVNKVKAVSAVVNQRVSQPGSRGKAVNERTRQAANGSTDRTTNRSTRTRWATRSRRSAWWSAPTGQPGQGRTNPFNQEFLLTLGKKPIEGPPQGDRTGDRGRGGQRGGQPTGQPIVQPGQRDQGGQQGQGGQPTGPTARDRADSQAKAVQPGKAVSSLAAANHLAVNQAAEIAEIANGIIVPSLLPCKSKFTLEMPPSSAGQVGGSVHVTTIRTDRGVTINHTDYGTPSSNCATRRSGRRQHRQLTRIRAAPARSSRDLFSAPMSFADGRTCASITITIIAELFMCAMFPRSTTAPRFYFWAYNPWARPVYWGWGWGIRTPWFYGGYFAPAPYYVSASSG